MFLGGAKEHPDCQARLQILQETAAQHGCSIREEDIFFTSWSYEEGEKIGYQIGENRENLPDVIVCANDYLALAVAAGLFNRGISLPEEILITGFDDVCAGQNFYPSLTTVGQDYKTIGSRACEWIFDRIEGKNVEREISLPSVFVVGESTQGASIEADKRRRIIGQNLYIDDINNSFLESRQAWMESHFLNSRSVERLRSALIDFYRRGSRYEGSNVSVILEKDFFNSVYEHRINLNEIRRAEEKMVLFAVRDGEELKVSQVDRTEIVPGYNGEDEPHMYIIVPLYVKNYVFGYGILADHNFLLRTRRLMIYFSKVQNALEHFRSNLYVDMVNSELLEISTKDSLTGVYNRLAYTKYVLPLFEQVQQEKQRMVIVFIDVNNMKTINDKYGHLQGDLALKIISEVIKKSIPSEWMALRYGGDEFMIVGKTDSLGNNKGKGAADQIEQLIEEIEKIEKSIWDGIIASAEEMSLPYDLTVSYGYTVSEPNQDKDLNEYVREADVNMYKMKKKLKEKMI